MDDQTRANIRRSTAKLRARLATYETRHIMAKFSTYILDRINNDESPAELSSEARQCAFALSILASTPEPANPVKFDDAAWKECLALLQEIFLSYLDMFVAQVPNSPPSEPSDLATLQVATTAFLHYFHAALNASTDQIAERIRTYLVPFDDKLTQLVGLSASTALCICDSILKHVELTTERLGSMMADERRLRHAAIDKWEQDGLTLHQVRDVAHKNGWVDHFTEILSVMDRLYRIDLPELNEQFGDAGQKFWNLFSTARGEAQEVEYLTDRLHYDAKPLVRFAPNQAAFVIPHHIYAAVLATFEEVLTGGPHRDSYFKFRDRKVEAETAAALGRLFLGARIYTGVFEAPNTQHEHDVVLIYGDTCIVAEVKASPPVEPFRDHERSFERIRRAFRSNRGIQKAYDQGCRIWQRWSRAEAVPLFDRKGTELLTITPHAVKRLFIFCVTRDDYGPLATDLSLLLQKHAAAPYPWAPNILALGHMIDGWLSLGFGADDFLAFIQSRIQLHHRVFGADELEFAGYYLRHGSMARLVNTEYDRVVLNPAYSDIFDEVYRSKHGGPPVKLVRTEPVETDIRGTLFENGESAASGLAPARPRRRQRPNDPCACQSGRKYKKCCGKT